MQRVVTVAVAAFSNVQLAVGLSTTGTVFDNAKLFPRIDLHQSSSDIVSVLTDAATSPDAPGFFYIINHDIPESVFDGIVKETYKFHSLPLRRKLEINAVGYGGGNRNKGYVPPFADGDFGKDAGDTRPDSEEATKSMNMREEILFRYPEEQDMNSEYLSDKSTFLKLMETTDGLQAASNFDTHYGEKRDRTWDRIYNATQRFFMKNQWPNAEEFPKFRSAAEQYFEEMRKLRSTMFPLFAQAIAKLNNSNEVEPIPHDKGMMTLVMGHYKAWKGDDDVMGIADHTDMEAFSMFYPMYMKSKHFEKCSDLDGNQSDDGECSSLARNNPNIEPETGIEWTGLEVWFQNRWVAVPHIPGAIILNQGDGMNRLSGFRTKAPAHRVRANNDFPRYSLVCFCSPNWDVLVQDRDSPTGKVFSGEHYLKRNHMADWDPVEGQERGRAK